jgi:hypothetical protein
MTGAFSPCARSFKAISPGMLPPLGIIFGLFVAFTAAQVWNDNERANTAVSREARALRAVVVLAASFSGEPEARLVSISVTFSAMASDRMTAASGQLEHVTRNEPSFWAAKVTVRLGSALRMGEGSTGTGNGTDVPAVSVSAGALGIWPSTRCWSGA